MQSYELADKYTNTTNLSEQPIEILIGCDQYSDIVTGDTVKGLTEKSPVAVSSIFGYLVCGTVVKTDRDTTKCRVVFDASSKERDNRFCLEEGPNTIPNILTY